MKRGALGDGFIMGTNYNSVGGLHSIRWSTDNLSMYIEPATGVKTGWTTTAVFRDPSAWYHVVFAFDTTQASVADMCKIYVNGVLQAITIFNYNASYISQNANGLINGTTLHTIGSGRTVYGYYFDGYMAEVNFVNGQALTPSSFGAYDAVTGVWQPTRYTGTYGTNGYYLKFASTGSQAALGTDSSGNSNTWTVNNFSVTAGTTYDPMVDSPTVGSLASNYGVFNPLKNGGGSITNANLQFTANTVANQAAFGSMAISSGKFYFEAYLNQGSPTGNAMIGVYDAAGAVNTSWYAATLGWALDSNADGNFYKRHAGTAVSYGARTNPATAMVAVDKDSNKIWFGYNGTWFASGDPAAGTNAAYTDLGSVAAVTVAAEVYANQGSSDYVVLNCGQRPFTYTPPTGFVALNTYNLPTPTIANGASYMAATVYSGNSSTNNINNGTNTTTAVSFKPDFVWVKNRGNAVAHYLSNSVTGAYQVLFSNLTSAEYNGTSNSDGVSTFNSNGFRLLNGTNALNYNQTGYSYVAWQWLAGAGSSSTNTAGSITSTVSVNATAGFSVVTYTGTGANATVGHGLGVAPSMILVKSRNITVGFVVGHTSLPWPNGYLQLYSTNGAGSASTVWNTSPTSTVFGLGTDLATNYNSSATYVAYCWSAVAGYSAFGSYTGNGSTDGPFIYTGFRSRWIMYKRTDSTGNWQLFDSSRSPYNDANTELFPNLANAEYTGANASHDIVSNGFKLRTVDADRNASGGTYIYAAFAENPFKYALAR